MQQSIRKWLRNNQHRSILYEKLQQHEAMDTPHTEGEYSTINLMRTRDIARTRDDKDTDVGRLGNTTINLTSMRDITRTRAKEDSDVGNTQQLIPQGQGTASKSTL